MAQRRNPRSGYSTRAKKLLSEARARLRDVDKRADFHKMFQDLFGATVMAGGAYAIAEEENDAALSSRAREALLDAQEAMQSLCARGEERGPAYLRKKNHASKPKKNPAPQSRASSSATKRAFMKLK